MSHNLSFAVVSLGVMILSGCASTILSDSRIKSATAGTLDVSPDEVVIANRRSETTNTYYTAATQSGQKYACAINGGTVLSMGLVNPPTCNEKAK